MKQSDICNSTNALVSLLDSNGTSRRSLNLPIILTGTDKIPQDCIATNVCLSGILLSCDSNSFSPDEILELEFKLQFDGISKRCRFLAKLASIKQNTLAIYFHQFNHEIFGFVKKLMFDADLRETIPEQSWGEPSQSTSQQMSRYGS